MLAGWATASPPARRSSWRRCRGTPRWRSSSWPAFGSREEASVTFDRRTLFSGLSSLAAGLALPSFRADALAIVAQASRAAGSRPASDLAGDEAYWSEIARAFDADRTLVNL